MNHDRHSDRGVRQSRPLGGGPDAAAGGVKKDGLSHEGCSGGAIMFQSGQPKRSTGLDGFREPPADMAHGRETAVLVALVKGLAREAARDAFKAASLDSSKDRLV